MKVVILYRPKDEYSRSVETFAHDYQSRHPSNRLELTNIDERDGIALASLYDIMSFPAILAMANNGSLLHLWQGPQLPLLDEVASYMVMT